MKKNSPKINLNELLNIPTTLSEKFHHKTKIKKIESESDPKSWPKEWKKVYFKAYARLDEYQLPKPTLPTSVFGFKKVLIDRISKRNFSSKPMSVDKLSSLLYFSAGMKNKKPPFLANRFYPSAGSRYPLEVYIISNKVQGLQKGLYHYSVQSHSLEKLLVFDSFRYTNYFGHKWVVKASSLIVITAMFKRTIIKYGDRGYRHTLIEAGHMGQNIYLVSTTLGLSCCAIGGFSDVEINKLLDIDGITESVLYILAVG